MIKALIIDDEEHCINRLKSLLMPSYKSMIEIVGTARTFQQAIKAITLLNPELIFLDVQLDDKTGFDLLKALPQIDFDIIFTTAYEEFAIRAIKFSAIDYLLKPIDADDLDAALLKLSNEKSKKITSQKIDLLLQNAQLNSGTFKKILVSTIAGFEFIDISNIVRCQSDINYTTIYLTDKQKLVVAKTLKEFEELLSEYSFFRVHNSHLINLSFIKSYKRGKGGSIKLTDGTEVEVSSRRKDEFLKKLASI